MAMFNVPVPAIPSVAPDLASQCCSALRNSSVGANVYLPGGAAYDALFDGYWSAGAALSPWCMALPETTEHVSTIMTTLTRHQCPFGVKGGGHASFPLANGVDEGVTIDFAYMNATTYDAATNIASVQPGGHWTEVYEALAPHGVTVTGGRAGSVGVGGFITGGGNSFHTAAHGFACDNVARFEVVLASGRVVVASADEHADLWRALKGSSGNLGLVTRFDLHAIAYPSPPSTDIWGGIMSYDLAHTDAVVDAYVAFADASHRGVADNDSVVLSWGWNPAQAPGIVLNVAIQSTVNEVWPAAFDGFNKTPGLLSSSLRSASMPELTAELGAGQPGGLHNIWTTGSYVNDARVIRFAGAKHEELVARLEALMPADSEAYTLCVFQPLTAPMVRHGAARGGNVMGLDEHAAAGAGVLALLTWSALGAENEALAAPLVREWQDSVDAYADALGLNWRWRFLNYADRRQDPLASNGAGAIARMRAASAKYDPDQVFQKLRKTGFKIPA